MARRLAVPTLMPRMRAMWEWGMGVLGLSSNGGQLRSVQERAGRPRSKEKTPPDCSGGAYIFASGVGLVIGFRGHVGIAVELRAMLKFILRKEVIQPQVPLRLPCYDLVPIKKSVFGAVKRLRTSLSFVA